MIGEFLQKWRLCAPILSALLFAALTPVAYGQFEQEEEEENPLAAVPFANSLDDEIRAVADNVSYVGSNMIARGNVRVHYGNVLIECDSAIANLVNKDLEAKGHVRFYQRQVTIEDLDPAEVKDYRLQIDTLVEELGTVRTGSGRIKIRTRITRMMYAWESDHVIGNLATGAMRVQHFYCMGDDNYFVRGEVADRKPGGQISVRNIKVTTCDMCKDDCEHYSITAGHGELTPNRRDMPIGLKSENMGEITNSDRYWITLSDNMFIRMFDIPVLWFPGAILPPGEEIKDWVKISAGYSSEWGAFFSLGKRFQLANERFSMYTEPSVTYFTKRGFGIGDETVIRTDRSWTQLNAFGIHDLRPNGGRDWEKRYDREYGRFNISKDRYDLKLQHVSHLTPRLDFRARLEAISDVNLLRDYYRDRPDNDAIATYFGLDYQFDRAIFSGYVRPKLNDWTTEVQTLPEFRLDLPRQKLFGSLYYQSENSVTWRKMKFPQFDRYYETQRTKSYDNLRFDTLQMLYHPLKIGWLNLVPRAGVRLTYFNHSSKQAVDFESLQYYKWANLPDYWTSLWDDMVASGYLDNFSPYDDKGGSKFRVLGEIGLEANTKIHRTWSDAKSAFWAIDGLRHVFIPYINYNYNPSNNINVNKLMFFDEIDRYGKQHFVRFGMKNALQTRQGPAYRERIHDWFAMENYFDYHIETQKGFSSVGDFGHVISFNPFPELKFTTELLLDLDPENNHNFPTIRNGQLVDRKGLSTRYISVWHSRLSYEFAKDFRVFAAYNYNDAYNQRCLYSMGSSLTDVLAGTAYPNRYFRYQEIRGGIEFPIPYIDRGRTRAGFEAAYDFETGYMREFRVKLGRNFHCWNVAGEWVYNTDRDTKGKRSANSQFVFSVGLSAFSNGKYLLKGLAKDGSE